MSRHFFVKLIPHRATFAKDMSPEERTVMQQHAAFWTAHMQQGHVVVFGPVLDPAGAYGMGVVRAENEEELHRFVASDPAAALMRFETAPMHAVLPTP